MTPKNVVPTVIEPTVSNKRNQYLMAGELIFQNVRCFACLSYTSLFLYATKQEGNLSSVTVVSPLSPTGPTVVDSSQPLVITYWRKKKRGFRDSDCLSLEEEHKFHAMFWRELDLRDMNIDKSAYDPVFNNELILFDSNDLYCIRLIEDKQLWMTYLQKVIAYNHNLHSICVPDEILIHILSYMNTRELLLRISILSSHMNILCRSNIIWQNLFAKKWPMCKRTLQLRGRYAPAQGFAIKLPKLGFPKLPGVLVYRTRCICVTVVAKYSVSSQFCFSLQVAMFK